MPSREPELYKDKIEVSLDGRQIFYLFFGGAVIVGLVFVLGVLVGRRVEARGHLDRADTSAARDPLAALDRLERSDNLSYHGALTGAQAPTDVEKAIGELEKRRAGGEAKTDAPRSEPVARPDKPDADKHADKRDDKHAADKRDSDKRDADKRDPDKRDPDKSDDKKSRKHDDARPDRDKKASHGDAVTHPDARTDARPADAHADKPATDGADAGKAERSAEARTRFTLQLSSFQDRSEAEAFLGSIKSAGFQPYLTEADVTGKGTFYRVRLGSYRSLEAANDAKAEYEKTSKKTAQVMHL